MTARTELLEIFALAVMNAERTQQGLPLLTEYPRFDNSGNPLPALRAGFLALSNTDEVGMTTIPVFDFLRDLAQPDDVLR